MTPPSPPDAAAARARVRRTLAGVLGVQVVTLVLLWLFQQHFSA